MLAIAPSLPLVGGQGGGEVCDDLSVPASLEALNASNSQHVDYIKYINSAGLHALNTLIQPAGIH